jgi:hypothetical protein
MRALPYIKLAPRVDKQGKELPQNTDEKRLNDNTALIVQKLSEIEKRLEALESNGG